MISGVLPEFAQKTISLLVILTTHGLCCVALARARKMRAQIIYSEFIRSQAKQPSFRKT